MGCVGAMDGRIAMCPNCHKIFAVCYYCNGKKVIFDKACTRCGKRLTPESVHFVGHMIEGESFYYTDKGEGHSIHSSNCKGMLFHNRDGAETGGSY